MRSISKVSSAAVLAGLLGLGCTPFLGPVPDGGAEHPFGDGEADMWESGSGSDRAADEPEGTPEVAGAVDIRDAEVVGDSPRDAQTGSDADGFGDANSEHNDSMDGSANGPPSENLALWLAADRGVVLENGLVASWRDQSGHGLDAYQDAPTARPSLLTAALVGQPVLRFSNNEILGLPAGFSDLTKGLVILAVARASSNAELMPEPIFAILNLSSQTVTNAGLDFQIDISKAADASGMPEFDYGVGDDFISSGLELDRWQLLEVIQGSGSPGQRVACETLINGNRAGMGPCSVPPVTYRDANYLGASVGLPADLAEVLIYDAEDPSVTKDAELYLEQKWRLQ
ncbi:MAG TPA: hypothetical protein VGK52_09280 [Polyangia bacterium]|jgi:hypothetical protein